MRLIGMLLLACVVVAAAKFVLGILFVAFCVLLLWGALTRPKEALGFMVLSIAASLVQVHPWISLVVFGVGAALLTVQRAL